MMFTVAALCACFILSTAVGQSNESPFVPLFNGRDLQGWVHMGDNPESFRAQEGAILCTGAGNYPNWLRSVKEYENFVLRFEYMTPGWCEAGVLLHAPLHGRASKAGIKIHLRHDQLDEGARSTGAIYDVLAPLARAAKPAGQWNRVEVHLNWPQLRVTLNGRLIQDVDMQANDKLRWRLRRGYIGFQDIGTRIMYRGVELRELPSQEQWTALFNGKDLRGWGSTGTAKWSVENGILVGSDGDGYLISENSFSDFELQGYVRTSKYANGGIFTRWQDEKARGYEAQIYNVLEATNPTGSLYGVAPARDPEARDGEWFLMQIISRGPYLGVRVNGETVAESNKLESPDRGKIALQMHSRGARIEFFGLKIKRLTEGK